MSLAYPARIDRADDGFSITFRDIPEAISAAFVYEEAFANATEVLNFTLESLIAEGRNVPMPSNPQDNEILIDPAASIQAELLKLARAGRLAR